MSTTDITTGNTPITTTEPTDSVATPAEYPNGEVPSQPGTDRARGAWKRQRKDAEGIFVGRYPDGRVYVRVCMYVAGYEPDPRYEPESRPGWFNERISPADARALAGHGTDEFACMLRSAADEAEKLKARRHLALVPEL